MARSSMHKLTADAVHWREYPVGFRAEVARAYWRTLLPLLVGVGVAFVLLLVGGLLGEEGMIDVELAHTLDLLVRMSMGVLLTVAYLAWSAVAVTKGLRESTTSKALDKATSSPATATAVPHPSQIADVITPSFGDLLIFAWVNIGIGALMLIPAFGTISEHEEARVLLWGSLAWIAVMVVVIVAVTRLFRPAHERRRARIAAHWTNKREVAAWRAARDAGGNKTSGDDITDQRGRLRLASTLTSAGITITTVALMFMYGYMFISYPEAVRSDSGPRARYGDGVESVLDWAMWMVAGCAVMAVALFVVGALIEGAARSAERASLRRTLENPGASRPPKKLLARYAERQPVRLAQVAAAFSGIAGIVGTATLLLGSVEMAMFEDGVESFAALQLPAAVTVAVAVVLFLGALAANAMSNIRGQALRNALMRRWPTPPPRKPGSDGKVAQVRKGPVLSRKK